MAELIALLEQHGIEVIDAHSDTIWVVEVWTMNGKLQTTTTKLPNDKKAILTFLGY